MMFSGSIQEMGLGGSTMGAPLVDPRKGQATLSCSATAAAAKSIDASVQDSPPSPPPTACPSPATSSVSIDIFSEDGDWSLTRCTSPASSVPLHPHAWDLEHLHIPPAISETEALTEEHVDTFEGPVMCRAMAMVPTASQLREALMKLSEGSDGVRLEDQEKDVEEEQADLRAMQYGGVAGYAAGPCITVTSLEQKLDEVKQLYKEKFGDDLDEEEEEEQADFRTMQYGGVEGYAAGPCITLTSLEQKFDEVKQLYMEKFGDDLDAEEEEEQADLRAMQYGGVDGYSSGPCITVSSLQQKLDEVKQLYMEKFSDDLHTEEEGEEQADFRAMQYGGVEGYSSGPCITVTSLEQRLDEVKQLYMEKFGDDLDEEEEEEQADFRAMQYGGVEGYAAGPCMSVTSLEQKLDEVKQLYMEKFGGDLDAEEEVEQEYEHADLGELEFAYLKVRMCAQ